MLILWWWLPGSRMTWRRRPSRLYNDTGWDAAGTFGLGGLYPRSYNPSYMHYLGEREKQRIRTGR